MSITNEELIAVVEGTADRSEEYRVLKAALADTLLYERLLALLAAEALVGCSEDSEKVEHVKTLLLAATRQAAQVAPKR